MTTKFIVKIGVVVFVISAVMGCEQSSLPPLKIQAGEIVPELHVKDLAGADTSISLASGKLTILNVWATWCGPCRYEMPSLDRLSGMLGNQHYSVVALSVDDDDHVVREFLIERQVGITSYMDPTMDVANQVFGVRAFPSTFIFGPDGRFLEVIEGWRKWDTPEMVKKFGEMQKLAQQQAKKPSK